MSGPAFRVGDAERDAAVSALGEHFAAGRLTKDEFDERSGRAWSARYADDLDELFTDLPQPIAVRAGSSPEPRARGPRSLPRLLLLAPVAMMAFGGLLFLIVWTAPWLLFVFGLLFLFGGPPGRRRHWYGHDGGPRSGWGASGWGSPGRRGWGPPGGRWDGSSRRGWDDFGRDGSSQAGSDEPSRRGWASPGREDRSAERRDWPPARPGWGPQRRGGWVSSR
ncbi:DUF1707 SHOCT-like domain-containing protein [Jiangella muralis]|uniref:DUF1707 SHOCT-like domain-containing protein n=1 Tax=Jiangella muralis TaxID=702383 RepID=UPI00069DB901|nr:DUF1707 domain-containing protein [Jiangella muralis]